MTPRWSPYSQKIAYLRQNGIEILHADGSNPGLAGGAGIRFLSDIDRNLLLGDGSPDPRGLPSGSLRIVEWAPEIFLPPPTRAGGHILLLHRYDLLEAPNAGNTLHMNRVTANGSGITEFLTNPLSFQFSVDHYLVAGVTDARYSPDGSRIAVASVPTSVFAPSHAVVLMNVDGTGKTLLPPFPPSALNPPRIEHVAWSPDGTKLAFSRHVNTFSASGHIFIADVVAVPFPQLQNIHRLMTLWGDLEQYPIWSPDGQSLVYTRNSLVPLSGSKNIWLVNLDGTLNMPIPFRSAAGGDVIPVGWVVTGQENDNDGDGYTVGNGDYNDNDPNIHPGAPEVCNGIDENCDSQIDERVQTPFSRDADIDGFGNPSNTTQPCTAPGGYVTNNTDCDDNNAAMHPGGTEVCNATDDNCDGQVDEGGVPGCGVGGPDSDGDGIANCSDACSHDLPNNDVDSDGVCGNVDNCPTYGCALRPGGQRRKRNRGCLRGGHFLFLVQWLLPASEQPPDDQCREGRECRAREVQPQRRSGVRHLRRQHPKSQAMTYDATSPLDTAEETVTAGASSLSYDATTDQYTYVATFAFR